MPEQLIRLIRIIHAFDHADSPEQSILRGIDLLIEENEFLAIHGRSGSGKSTLLYIIGGILKPNRGEVVVQGRSIFTMKDRELSDLRNRMIGFVFQSYYLAPALTAIENVMVPALLAGQTYRAARARAHEKLEEVALSDKAGSRPAELSGGQMQRVAIARALVNDPPILLADEPTGNLDEQTGADVLALIARYHREHRLTVVMATHDESVELHATRQLRIAEGEIGPFVPMEARP